MRLNQSRHPTPVNVTFGLGAVIEMILSRHGSVSPLRYLCFLGVKDFLHCHSSVSSSSASPVICPLR